MIVRGSKVDMLILSTAVFLFALVLILGFVVPMIYDNMIYDNPVEDSVLGSKSMLPTKVELVDETNPERIAKDPRDKDYDSGYYKCNTTLVNYKGFVITFWTDGVKYGPGNAINGFLRIEAESSRPEGDVDTFHPGCVHVAALRFPDRFVIRNDEQQPRFYHVRRQRLGLEAQIVDMVSTSSFRVGQDRKNWLPCGPYFLEFTVQKNTHDSVQISDIYVEIVERQTGDIFNPSRLRKARLPNIAIPSIQDVPKDNQAEPPRMKNPIG